MLQDTASTNFKSYFFDLELDKEQNDDEREFLWPSLTILIFKLTNIS